MLIRSRAPLRVSIAGGGTDVSPYAEEYGGAVLSMTIDKYAYANLRTLEDGTYRICDVDDDLNETGSVDDELSFGGRHDLAKSVINRFQVKQGFDLELHSDAPWGSGLGSSSTHIVAVIGAFARRLGRSLTPYEMAEMAYDLERVDLGQAGGKQDQYSAAFGGTNFIEFDRQGAVVSPLRVDEDVMNELHYRMVLCFLGRTRMSSRILDDQISRVKNQEVKALEALHATKQLAYDMRGALLRGQIDLMGEILREAWVQKSKFSSLISDDHIRDVCESALNNGAIGGKVLGAGDGGYMLFICREDTKHRLISHLNDRDLSCLGFAFEPNGQTSWTAS